jgi:hypothetical protein
MRNVGAATQCTPVAEGEGSETAKMGAFESWELRTRPAVAHKVTLMTAVGLYKTRVRLAPEWVAARRGWQHQLSSDLFELSSTCRSCTRLPA